MFIGRKMDLVEDVANLNLGNFEPRYSIKAFDRIPVTEYTSKATGLTVVIAEIDGPVVNGHFCLATEAHDDDGLPHTLEHLVFLGSENYPYKGVLDLLANRCLASGTNAGTQTDHTFYTVETAGSEGFLALLPIYLEHILYPTLADEAYVTEVHHITAEGGDAGVVYCEMQGRENSAECRLLATVLKNLYPGHCGYSAQVGGIMKNLRESTSNTKVRDFHKTFYRPENLKVIITGQVNPDDVFKVLAPLEAAIIAKGPRGPFERPWQTPVPDITEPKDMVIKYPADEETSGMYCAAWRGPSIVNDYYTFQAVSLLLRYLTQFPTSPLPKEFVEIENPYASDVSSDLNEYSESTLFIILSDVPVSKLSEVGQKLKDKLKNIVDNNDIDMVQLHSVITKNKLGRLSSFESSPHATVANMIIGHMLYGRSQEDLEQRTNPFLMLSKLLDEPKSFWVDLVDKYLVNNKKAIYLQSVPSIELEHNMQQEEKDRIQLQIDTLKPEGLQEKKELLEKAIAHNEIPPPLEMLTSVPIPSVGSIKFHKIEQFNSDSEPNERIDLSNTPVYTYFDHLETNFAFLFATLDTSSVPSNLRIYIPLVIQAILELPVERDGELIPYEQVVAQLNDETIGTGSNLGLQGGELFITGNFSSTANVIVQVESSKYQIGLRWLREILYKTVFTADRIKVIANKMNNSVSQFKRDGVNVVISAIKGLRFVEDSNIIKYGVFQQSKFLDDVITKLESPLETDVNSVIDNIENVRKMITDPSNVVLYVCGNLNLINNPAQPLNEFLPEGLADINKQTKLNVTPDSQLLKDSTDTNHGCIIGMGSLESSYLMQTTPSISSKLDPDYVPLKVFLHYLSQLEGPLWKTIRGKGFAYSYGMALYPDQGLLYLDFGRATNVIGAYKATKAIVDKHLTNQEWDETLIASAKSSLIFLIINLEKTASDATDVSFISNFFGVDFSFNRSLLEPINNVTVEDLHRVAAKYVTPLFDPNQVKTAITTDPAKVDEIAAGFKELGLNLEVYHSLEESFLNKM